MVIREVLHHHLVCAVMCVHSLVIAQTVFNFLYFLNDISHFLHKIHKKIISNVL